jgi:putative membrane protein
MLLTKREVPILVVNLIYIPIFTTIALRRANFEFMLYIAVILIIGALILWKQRKVQFDGTILWGLTAWGLLHMAGGNLHVGDGVLYGLILVPLVDRVAEDGGRIVILRYDQFVHVFGFGVSTLIAHHLLHPYLRERIERWGTLAFLVMLMGSGFGALNEIIEFFAVLIVPDTGVGGYCNTLLDLCFNLAGGILAVIFLTWRRGRKTDGPET